MRMCIAKLEEQLQEPAALPGEAKSDCELREFVLVGILRLQDEQRQNRRHPGLHLFYLVLSCTLYVVGSALFVILRTVPIRPIHNLATLGRNKTSNQNSELVSGMQPLVTMSR